jgi:hypothetical protein
MELREVPQNVLNELGEKKIRENFVNGIFHMRLSDGRIVDAKSFGDFIEKHNIKSGSVISLNFKYVRWEYTEDLTIPQIKNYIKQQLTNNDKIILSEVKKALIHVHEELKNKQVEGHLDGMPIQTSNFVEQGKFYMRVTMLPGQACQLLHETINEMDVEKNEYVNQKIKRDRRYTCFYIAYIIVIIVLWFISSKYVFICTPKYVLAIIALVLHVTPFIMRFINHSYIKRAFCAKKAKIIYEKEFRSQL